MKSSLRTEEDSPLIHRYVWENGLLLEPYLIDIFRYALSLKIPLRGCITSGTGEISKTKRILGPIADEASKYYEMTNWIGIIVTNHPAIVLNNKASINPNPEIFEPFLKYNVPIKRYRYDKAIRCYQLEHGYDDMWTLRWPIHQGFNRFNGNEVSYIVPTNKTEYGDIIPNHVLIEVIKEGICTTEYDISQKWKNTWNYFNYVGYS